MNFKASEEEIAAAKAYENLHVPALFRQWAPRMVEAAEIRQGHRVLDIACGTGILAREASSRLGQDGYIAGLDASRGMLAVAQQLDPSIDWKEGVAEKLPYQDNSFDAVLSQFALMFFQDRPAALREMLRVLVSGGRIVVAVWESLENSEAYPIEVSVLDRLAGKQAADALRSPFILGDRAELKMLFQDAGVNSVEIVTHPGTARFPSIRTMVEGDLRGWLPVMGVNLNEEQIESILKDAEGALSQYVKADGTVQFSAPAHIVTGNK
jgi:SAM-dependent methyltransferase